MYIRVPGNSDQKTAIGRFGLQPNSGFGLALDWFIIPVYNLVFIQIHRKLFKSRQSNNFTKEKFRNGLHAIMDCFNFPNHK